MRKLIVVGLVVLLMMSQLVFVFAQNERPTVHFPVLPSRVVPIAVGIDVLSLDESMDEIYQNSSACRYTYLIDENLDMSGPYYRYSDEYRKLLGDNKQYAHPTYSTLFQEVEESDSSFVKGYYDSGSVRWVYGTNMFYKKSNDSDDPYVYLIDATTNKLITRFDEYIKQHKFLSVISERIALFRKIESNGYPAKISFVYFDFIDEKIVFESGESKLIWAIQDIILTDEKIINIESMQEYKISEVFSGKLNKISSAEKIFSDNGLLFLSQLDYEDGTKHNCIISTNGELLKDCLYEEEYWNDEVLDFTDRYILYKSYTAIEGTNQKMNEYFRVVNFDSGDEILRLKRDYLIPVNKEGRKDSIIGNYLFLRDKGSFDIVDLRTKVRVKRVFVNRYTKISKWNDEIYAVDYTHPFNRNNSKTVCTFRIDENLEFDYNNFIPESFLKSSRSSGYRGKINLNISKNDDYYTLIFNKNKDSRASFQILKEDYFLSEYHSHLDDNIISYHENGLIRTISDETGDIREYDYPKLELEDIKVLPPEETGYCQDVSEHVVQNDDNICVVIETVNILDSKKNEWVLIVINLKSSESKVLFCSSKPKDLEICDEGLAYYDDKQNKLILKNFDGRSVELNGYSPFINEDYLYYLSNNKSTDSKKKRTYSRISIETFVIQENIFEDRFPEVESSLLENVRIFDHRCLNKSIMLKNAMYEIQNYAIIYNPHKSYQNRIIFSDYSGSQNLFESTPCSTYAVKEISRNDGRITFEFISTRDDGLVSNWEGKVCLLGWGHEEDRLKEGLVPASPNFSRLDSEIIKVGPLAPGEKQTVTLSIPSRESILLESDIKNYKDNLRPIEEMKFLSLTVESNGVLDIRNSELPFCNTNRDRFSSDYPSVYDRQCTISRTFWGTKGQDSE